MFPHCPFTVRGQLEEKQTLEQTSVEFNLVAWSAARPHMESRKCSCAVNVTKPGPGTQ